MSAPHQRLSESLAQIVEANSTPDGITLNELLDRTEGRGIYLVIMLLALPFIVPVSIPGVSTVLGLSIAWLALRLALGKPPRLPKLLGDRRLKPEFQRKVLNGSLRVLRFIEKLVHPRRTPWMTLPPARFANALLLMFMGILLALPFPPLPPMTNSLPCYSILLLAASMMEEDGVLIWVAYAVCFGTIAYLVFIAEVLEQAVRKGYELFRRWRHG